MACARCGCIVCQAEDFIALNKIWHKCCFRCYKCGGKLEKCTAKIFQGELFCKCCYYDTLENFNLISCSSSLKPCKVVSSPSCLCEAKLGCGEKIDGFRISFPIDKKTTCNKPTKSCSCLPDKKPTLFNFNKTKNGGCVIIPLPREVANYYNRNTVTNKLCNPTQADFYNIDNLNPRKMKITTLSPKNRPCKSPQRNSNCPPPDKCCCPKPHPDRCCCPKPSEKCKCCPQKCTNCCPKLTANCYPKVLPDRCLCRRCCRDSNPCRPPDSCCYRDGNPCRPPDNCCYRDGNPCRPPDNCCYRDGNPCRPPDNCCYRDSNECRCADEAADACCRGPDKGCCLDKCCCPKCSPPTKCCCPRCTTRTNKGRNCSCAVPPRRCASPPRAPCCAQARENCQKCCRRIPPGPKYCACGNPNPCDCKIQQVRDVCTACCVRCGCKVYAAEKVVVSSGAYHTSCFSCYCCNKSLDVINVYEGCGEIYCKQCYNNFFGIQYYGRAQCC